MKRNLYLKLAAAIVIAAAFFTCTGPVDNGGEDGENIARLEGTDAPDGRHEGKFATITISSAQSWRIEITNISPEGGEEWITPSLTSGWGGGSVNLACTVNSGEKRTAQVAVHFDTSTTTFDISQDKAGSTAVFDGETVLRYDQLYSDAFLRITSEEEWEIDITDKESGEPIEWLTSVRSEGSGDADVEVNNTVNHSSKVRTATITVSFPSRSVTIDISQAAAVEPPQELPGWIELPEFKGDDHTFFIAHFTSLNGENVRNYSMCYDAFLFGSYWVAYPIHESYTGEEDRSDEWAYDPSLPAALQFRYHNLAFGTYNYDRGHQVPSADRTATLEMNEQTFYSTNLTPQRWKLNQQKWRQLEDWFRDQLNGRDTVWMVTGAHYSEQPDRITNANNPTKEVAIPAAYYKVAVRMKNSAYTAIGFWQDNVDTDRTSPSIPYSEAKTVRWIEEKTGINFFVNISAAEQDVFENTVVQSDWNWRR